MANQVKVDKAIFKPVLMVEADRKTYEYVNGQRTNNCTGVSIPCVLPSLKFEKVNVRIEDPNHELLFPEGVTFPDAPPEVDFDGLEAYATSSRNEFGVTIRATATNARLATAAAPSGRPSGSASAPGKDDK